MVGKIADTGFLYILLQVGRNGPRGPFIQGIPARLVHPIAHLVFRRQRGRSRHLRYVRCDFASPMKTIWAVVIHRHVGINCRQPAIIAERRLVSRLNRAGTGKKANRDQKGVSHRKPRLADCNTNRAIAFKLYHAAQQAHGVDFPGCLESVGLRFRRNPRPTSYPTAARWTSRCR
jgi:hypothetical protein